MPLRWERAYGGLNLAENPMGRGIEPWIEADGRKHFYLANIEPPGTPIRAPGQAASPACFAPILPDWQPRFGRQGTRDQRWATFIAPLPPHDHDQRTAQVAPEDQWISGYWRGDERITLTNLHPLHASFATSLPGKRLRLFIEVAAQDSGKLNFGEIPLDLDTIHIDMTAERMHLVWRRQIRPRTAGGREIVSAYLVEEPLTEPPASVEAHYRGFLALKPAEGEPLEEQMLRDEKAALAEARKTLVDGKIDPATIAKFDAAPDSEAKFAIVIDLIKSKTAELEAVTASLK